MSATMEPRIQYAKTSDGVNIAYATAGEGKCIIGVPSPPLSHVQRQSGIFPGFYQGLAQRFRSVWYDSRGSGLSDRDSIDFSMPAMLRDLEAVADRAGGSEFALYTVNDGGPIAISYAAARPERLSHLVLIDCWARFSDYSQSPAIQAETMLRGQDWTIYTETVAKVLIGYEDPAFAAAPAEHIRASVEPEALRAAYSRLQDGDWDVIELLDQMLTPTLVVHNRGFRFLPVQVGQRLAAAIPDARFLEINDMTYADVSRLIEDFIQETSRDKSKAASLASGTAIILFADIVLAVFTSARQAIEAALACAKAGAEASLPLHLGLHAGDVIREDNNVYGGAVNVASRIAGLSSPGEVLVSETVRSLARTSAGVRFEDRGEQALKGVGEPVRVWAVREGAE